VSRFLAIVLLLLVSCPMTAQAQTAAFTTCDTPTSSTLTSFNCSDEGRAYATGYRFVAAKLPSLQTQNPALVKACVVTVITSPQLRTYDDGQNRSSYYVDIRAGTSNCATTAGSAYISWWPAANDCSTRAKSLSGIFDSMSAGTCYQGCEYTLQDATMDQTLKDVRTNEILARAKKGRYAPTGNACSAGETRPDPKQDFCQALDGGHKICPKEDGGACVVSGKTGRSYCFAKSQSGPAVDPTRKEAVVKSADAPPPGLPNVPPSPRTNENWSSDGPGTSVTNNTTNQTNNYNNFSNTGTPNTDPNAGVPGDGSDNPGEGEGEGDEGTASGGGTCDAPPVCSGNPIDCAILDQTWRNRCESGGDENGNGQPDWTELGEGEGSEGPAAGAGEEKANEWDFSTMFDQLDDAGFLSDSCPEFPPIDVSALGIAFDADMTWWCEAIAAIGALFLFLGACTAIAILVS